MLPIAHVAQLRIADANADVPISTLVNRAGHAVAANALEMMHGAYGKRVLLVAGTGNNGADGRVAADYLRSRGSRVDEIAPADFSHVDESYDLVIDAAYGTGFRSSSSWNPPTNSNVPVLAVDLPSGLDADTGEIHGSVLSADRTVTFAALKPGLLFGHGPEVCGEVVVADIGLTIPADECVAQWVTREDVTALLQFRSVGAHKWHHGVKVIAGSRGMTGAARLAADSALHAGAGIVHAFIPGAAQLPSEPIEVVWHSLPDEEWGQVIGDEDSRFKSGIVGPGIGRADATVRSASSFISSSAMPLVVDGDGLYAVAVSGIDTLCEVQAPRVLTPHEGEFAQLMGAKPESNHINAALELAKRCNQTVLLKGHITVVARGDRAWAMQCGDERLATAGSGDVLAGVVGAFLAYGLEPEFAAICGAVIHGAASEILPSVGMTAGDLPFAVSSILSEIKGRE